MGRTLSDITTPRLTVACDRCGRRSSYAERGDLKLTDFLAELKAACPKAGAVGLYEKCGARFVL